MISLSCLKSCFLLAQGEGGGALPLPIIMGGLMLLFWLLIMRPEQKKKKNQQNQLESLKKNDRIVTIGGIYGTVVNVQRDVDEITIRVDETNNSKICVTVGAIARIITKDKDASE